MASSTVENYLKRLYLEQGGNQREVVPMGRLASAMGVVPGTATAMVKALSGSGLVEYEPRSGARLTAAGEKLAIHVLRRHRLLELFLVERLGLDWTVVHDEAELLEHAVSDRVLERIDELLGYPTVDPHGDPIPNAKGDLQDPQQMSLADCPVGQPQRIVRILHQQPEFLQFVGRHGLIPGATLTVEKREPSAEAVKLRLASQEEVSLGLTAAARILVQAQTD